MRRLTVLCSKGVIRCAKIDEPIPVLLLPHPEQYGASMERVGYHRRAPVSDHVGFLDHAHVTDGRKDSVARDAGGELAPLPHRRLQIEVHDVEVVGMVHRPQRAPEAVQVALRPGYQVGEPRKRRGRGRRSERHRGCGGYDDDELGAEGGDDADVGGDDGDDEEGRGQKQQPRPSLLHRKLPFCPR